MRWVVGLLAATLILAGPNAEIDKLSAGHKINMIQDGQVPPGTSEVNFREKELNHYLEVKSKEYVPDGIRDTRLELRKGGQVTGYAMVDLVKMQHAKGQDLNWLMRKLLEGEKPLKVVGRLQTNNGTGKVDIERVEIGGVPLSGTALDLMVRTFVKPLFPSAKVGETFELGYDMERIEVHQSAAKVVMSSNRGAVAQR